MSQEPSLVIGRRLVLPGRAAPSREERGETECPLPLFARIVIGGEVREAIDSELHAPR